MSVQVTALFLHLSKNLCLLWTVPLKKKQGQNPLLFWSICLASSTPQAFVLLRYKILLNKYLPSCGFLANKRPLCCLQNPKITLFEPPYLHSSDRAPFLSAQLWRILIAVAKTNLHPSMINIIKKQTKSCSLSKICYPAYRSSRC